MAFSDWPDSVLHTVKHNSRDGPIGANYKRLREEVSWLIVCDVQEPVSTLVHTLLIFKVTGQL